MVPMVACFVTFGNLAATGICIGFVMLGRLLAFSFSIVSYVGLIYAYDDGEDCGDLTILVMSI